MYKPLENMHLTKGCMKTTIDKLKTAFCTVLLLLIITYLHAVAYVRFSDMSFYSFRGVDGRFLRVLGCPPLQQCLKVEREELNWTEGKSNIGAYYQTTGIKQVAMEFVLVRFRSAYPTSKLVLYADGDQTKTFSYMMQVAHAFNASITKGYHDSYSVLKKGMWFNTVQSAMAYAWRLAYASYDTEWMFLLEDDVWLCTRVNESQLIYHMNGHCKYTYDEPIWRVVSNHTAKRNCYGGCGGFILNSTFLRYAVRHANLTFVEEMINALPRPIASDELISALFLYANGTIGKIDDYDEGIDNRDMRPVVRHQMKHLYPKHPLTAALGMCMVA